MHQGAQTEMAVGGANRWLARSPGQEVKTRDIAQTKDIQLNILAGGCLTWRDYRIHFGKPLPGGHQAVVFQTQTERRNFK